MHALFSSAKLRQSPTALAESQLALQPLCRQAPIIQCQRKGSSTVTSLDLTKCFIDFMTWLVAVMDTDMHNDTDIVMTSCLEHTQRKEWPGFGYV